MALKYIQTKATALSYSISDVSTTIQLKKLLKLDGSSISASDVGDVLYGTFGPGTDREEIFSINGANVTVESDGKISITGVTRGLKEVSPYDAGGFKCDHPANEVVVFGNNPQLFDYLKSYVDNAVIGGGIQASDTVPGISMEATVDDINNDTATRDYNSLSYRLFINPAKLILSKFGLRLPSSGEKSALAGSQGVPSSTNTYITKDNVYDSDTDQTQATQNGTSAVGDVNSTGSRYKLAQSFVPNKTKIRGVKLYKSADTGTFTGTVTVDLMADTTGSPSGTSLATKTFSNVEWLGISVGEFETLFTSEYSSLVSGNLYWVVISTSTGDTSNRPNLGINTAGGYADGGVKYWNTTDGWVAVSTIDLYFKTLQGINNQILKTNDVGKIRPENIDNTSFNYPLNAIQEERIVVSGTNGSNNGVYGTYLSEDGLSLYSIITDYNGTYYPAKVYKFEYNNVLQIYELKYISATFNTRFGVADREYGITQIGNYIYISTEYDNSTSQLYRLDSSNLANVTQMTISGTAYEGPAFSDGTFLYIFGNSATNTAYKYSISGTVATYVEPVTFTDAGSVASCAVDGGIIYVTTSISAANSVIKKYRITGGSAIASLTIQYPENYLEDSSRTAHLSMSPYEKFMMYIYNRGDSADYRRFYMVIRYMSKF